MKQLRIVLIMMSFAGLFSPASNAQTKWAQTGFDFLMVPPDARAAGIGDAVNSLPGNVNSLFHNPATMAEMPSVVDITAGVNSWIADIKHLSFGVAVAPFSGNYGVIGLSLQSVDYGDIQGTMVYNNNDSYIDTGNLNPSALAVGIGYAKMISEQFGVGAQVRLCYQSLGTSVVPSGGTLVTKQNTASAVAYDFGTIFNTGIKSLAFGMSIRNFSQNVTYEQESFQLPLLFTIGISANVFDFIEMKGPDQSLIISCDATHPRSHPEQLKIGLEYQFMKLIALRGGYITGDSEDGATFGLGLSSAALGISAINFNIDYSYTPFGVFNNVQRFTVRFTI